MCVCGGGVSVTKWQQQPHLGACWKCRFPGSSPDLVRNGISGMGPSKLYHNKYSGIFLCLVNFRSSESVLLPYPRGDLVKEPISPKSHTWLRASHGEEANRCLGEGSPSQGFPSRQARLSCSYPTSTQAATCVSCVVMKFPVLPLSSRRLLDPAGRNPALCIFIPLAPGTALQDQQLWSSLNRGRQKWQGHS